MWASSSSTRDLQEKKQGEGEIEKEFKHCSKKKETKKRKEASWTEWKVGRAGYQTTLDKDTLNSHLWDKLFAVGWRASGLRQMERTWMEGVSKHGAILECRLGCAPATHHLLRSLRGPEFQKYRKIWIWPARIESNHLTKIFVLFCFAQDFVSLQNNFV